MNGKVKQIPQKQHEIPEKRWHDAVWEVLEDLGEQDYGSGSKLMSHAWFKLTDENRSDGTPFRINRLCAQSLDRRSTLFEMVSELIGYAPPANFDFETLEGTPCKVEVVHKETASGIFANAGRVRGVETAADKQSRDRIAQVTEKVRNQPQPAAQAAGSRSKKVTTLKADEADSALRSPAESAEIADENIPF
jgi:hypothetical protein